MARRVSAVLLFIGLPILLAFLVYSRLNQYQPYGTRLLNPRPAYDFSLSAQGGKTYQLSDFRGKVTLIFFGFVNCPDVCPTTMLELGKVYKALSPQDQQKVQVLLISVDPERDTPELLGKYVSFFDPSFIGLTGSPEQIAETAKQYGVFYQKSNIKSAREYNVDHTATVFAIDPKGNLRLIYGNGKAKETPKVIEDIRWLMRS